ncbi:MAG: aldolase/citrate lyase family protein [Paracoccaceae bacterium]|nr:aldolase/citrate lyase family protein [Paracoccaceae bacterium]
MRGPTNRFKSALKEGRHQLGIWNSIGGNTVPELLGGAGFDWVLIDCEHGPIETVEVLPALQTLAAFPEVSAVVRPAANDPVLFKRLLDMGAQSLLVPYIQSAEEARAAVAAMRYGPRGIRGMAGMTRATRYGRVENYFAEAERELCLIVQIESEAGVEAFDEIVGVDGVDGAFVGPTDLSASLGHPGEVSHPVVTDAIDHVFARGAALGVPVGLMALEEPVAKARIAGGSAFTAVGVDLVLLAEAVARLRAAF